MRQRQQVNSAGGSPKRSKPSHSLTSLANSPAQSFTSDSANLNTPDAILNLQHLIGNHAVQRMLRGRVMIQRRLSGDLGESLSGEPKGLFERLKKILEAFAVSDVKDEQKLAERQEAYYALKDAIAHSELKENEKTVIMGLLLEGSLEWSNTIETEGEKNEFSRYFLHSENEADPEIDLESGTLNCWETVLFIAYSAGTLSRRQVHDLYWEVPLKPIPAVMNFLGFQRRHKKYNYTNIAKMDAEPGEIVFFSIKKTVVHVALALGGTEILSLWNEPGGITTMQRTTADAIIGSYIVSIATAPWSSGKSEARDAMAETHRVVGEEIEQETQADIKIIYERIPSKPSEAALEKELEAFVRKIVKEDFEKQGPYFLTDKVRAQYPQMFVYPKERLLKILKPYVDEDFHIDVEMLIEGNIKDKSIKDIIGLVFNDWQILKLDETTPAEKQKEAVLKSYDESLKKLERL